MTDKQDITPTLEDYLAAKPFLNRYILDSPYSDGAGELAKAFAIHAAKAREEGARMMREAAHDINHFILDLDPAEIVKGKA